MSTYEHSGETQIFLCCKALLDGRTISHKTEIREVNGWRLGAIIHELKKTYNWPIEVRYQPPENVAYYKLGGIAEPANLRLPPSAKSLRGYCKGGGN